MAPGTIYIPVAGDGATPQTYTVPGSVVLDLGAVRADFDGSGTAAEWIPAVQILDSSNHIMAQAVGSTVPAGGSASVTFAPFLRGRIVTSAGTLQNRNLGELGYSIGTTLADTFTHTIQIQDALQGDGILVSVSAPSLPSGGGNEGFLIDCQDSQGNSYFVLTDMELQAFSPGVNTGEHVRLYYCASSVAPLVAGVDTITLTWDEPVYDRMVGAYLVRHVGGANIPTVLGQTPDHSGATFAASQVTLTEPDWTPARDDAFTFALIYSARAIPGGSVAFGGVGGYVGFYEAGDIVKTLTGAKQSYSVHPQTHAANIYVQIGPGITTNEIDLGTLPGGVLVPSFNGVGQRYLRPPPTPEVNVWKGIILLGLD